MPSPSPPTVGTTVDTGLILARDDIELVAVIGAYPDELQRAGAEVLLGAPDLADASTYVVTDALTGTPRCSFEHDGEMFVARHGPLVDGIFRDFACETLWTADVPSNGATFPVDGGLVVTGGDSFEGDQFVFVGEPT